MDSKLGTSTSYVHIGRHDGNNTHFHPGKHGRDHTTASVSLMRPNEICFHKKHYHSSPFSAIDCLHSPLSKNSCESTNRIVAEALYSKCLFVKRFVLSCA